MHNATSISVVIKKSPTFYKVLKTEISNYADSLPSE